MINPQFRYSFIEKDAAGKMYLPINSQIATIENADEPNNLIWTENAITFPGTFEYNLSNAGNSNDTYRAYTLPDQIDVMDYDQFLPPVFDIDNYSSSSGYDSWIPSDNPLNNGSGNEVIGKKMNSELLQVVE